MDSQVLRRVALRISKYSVEELRRMEEEENATARS